MNRVRVARELRREAKVLELRSEALRKAACLLAGHLSALNVRKRPDAVYSPRLGKCVDAKPLPTARRGVTA